MGIDIVLPLVSLVLFVLVVAARGTRVLSARQASVGLIVALLALWWAELAQWSRDPGPAWASWAVDGESTQLVREGLLGRLAVLSLEVTTLIGGGAVLLAVAALVVSSDAQRVESTTHEGLIAPSSRVMRRLSALRSGASGTPHGPPSPECRYSAA